MRLAPLTLANQNKFNERNFKATPTNFTIRNGEGVGKDAIARRMIVADDESQYTSRVSDYILFFKVNWSISRCREHGGNFQ